MNFIFFLQDKPAAPEAAATPPPPPTAPASTPPPPPKPAPLPLPPPQVAPGGRVFASPLAKKIAQEKGIELSVSWRYICILLCSSFNLGICLQLIKFQTVSLGYEQQLYNDCIIIKFVVCL